MKRVNLSSRDQVAKLQAMISDYERHPLPDMVQRATEEISKAVDLSETEQNQLFESIERLAAKEKAAETVDSEVGEVDEASVKLVALLKGELLNTRDTIVLIRRWFNAKCRNDLGEVADCIKRLCVVCAAFEIKLEANCRLTDILPLVHLWSARSSLKRRLVPAKDHQVEALRQAFVAVSSGHEMVGAFEQLHADPWEFANEPTKLLYHCTKLATNLDSILNTGMRPGTGGRLGAAVYLADIMTKCMGYCGQAKLSEDDFYGTILVAQVAPGTLHTTTMDGAHPGTQTIFAHGIHVPSRECAVRLSDGTSSLLPIGPYLVRKARSSFQHNEYAVRDTRRIRVRFVILFKKTRDLPAPAKHATTVPLTLASSVSLSNVVDLTEDTPVDSLLTKAMQEWDSKAKRVRGANEPLTDFMLHQKWLDLIRDIGKRIQDIELRFGLGAAEASSLRDLVKDLGDPRTKEFMKHIMFKESADA